MTNLEFITSNKIASIPEDKLYDFLIDRILDNRILLVEKKFNPVEKMSLIARGLERSVEATYCGIKMLEVKISSQSGGLLRNKSKEILFNLITPGNSVIYKREEGLYSIKTENNSEIAAYIS